MWIGFDLIFGPHFLASHELEPFLVPLDGLSVAAAHYLNWKLFRTYYWFTAESKNGAPYKPEIGRRGENIFYNYFAIQKSKCNFAAIVKGNIKSSVSKFSRFLVGLLAVFYVSVFVIEATHTHESLVEAVSSDSEKNQPEASDCKICAYFAHHANELITASPTISFALFLTEADPTITPLLTHRYEASIEHFINRGPPYLFV